MRKVLDLDERFYGTGEPTLMVVARAHGHRWLVEKTAGAKTASPAFDYIKAVAPRPGETLILVNALGAYETYDDNRNGDGFPEHAYRVGKPARCGHPQCSNELRGWIEPGHVLTEHYKTFEQHGGIYKHHVNKDPSKSLGKVEQAFWNPYMHRVELLLAIRNALDPELVARINDGEYPAVSMGCHVRYDVCSICGHRAPTRKDYCEHAKFRMREIVGATGERVCVLNPMPRFFDISIVHRPADPTGFMLKKVAHEVWGGSSAERGEKLAAIEEKQARVRKFSAIQKELIGETEAARFGPDIALVRKYRREMLPDAARGRRRLGPQDLLAVGQYSVPQVVSSVAAKNAALTTGEFAELYLRKLGFAPSEAHLDRIVALQPLVHEAFARYPGLDDKLAALVEVDARHVREDLQRKLGAWLEKRAAPFDWVRQQALQAGGPLGDTPWGRAYQAREPARTDMLTMTDPHTGEVYRTTRGAAQGAHGQNVKALLGATALVSGALALKHPVLGLASAPFVYAGAKRLMGAAPPYTNSRYQTDQGLLVPGNTEFVKSSGERGVAVSATTMLNKLAYDYLERLPDADLGRSLHAQLLAKVAAPTGSPFAVLMGSAAPLETKVAVLCAPAERAAADATEPPDVDLVRLSEQLGSLIER